MIDLNDIAVPRTRHDLAAVKERLHERFGIGKSTIELECAVHACADAPALGPGPAPHGH